MRQKRAAAIHDISCFGKCSLTVALPILSAAGIEACPIPTSMLSTHTGGFNNIHIRDLTADIMPTAEHWRGEGLRFDALYSGYLGSYEQLDIVSRVFGLLRTEETLVVVDPVMADHGRLYGGFDADFPAGMLKLCRAADVITPNMTEAVFMLGEQYRDGPYDTEYVRGLLGRLRESAGGRTAVVLTGVYYDSERLGAACLDRDGAYSEAFAKRCEGAYHGTGDIFTSVLTACLLRGYDMTASMQKAADFVAESVERTARDYPYMTYGVNFEAGLASLAEK